MYNFDVEKPGTIAEAATAMGAEDAQALGGGQTLIPTLKQRLASPSKLVSLSSVAEMQGITKDGGTCASAGRQPMPRLRLKAATGLCRLWLQTSAIRQCAIVVR